jgi:hypothetical protein
MEYITAPKLYNTGFLLDDDVSRVKQGLFTQDLSSDCFVTMPYQYRYKNIFKNTVGYNNNLYKNALQLARTSTDAPISRPILNKNLLYPIHNEPINYGSPSIPNNCICLENLRAP